jgi:hypothetical protein
MTRLATCLRTLSPARKPRPLCRELRAGRSRAKAAIANIYPNGYAFLSDRIGSTILDHPRSSQVHLFCCLFTNGRFGLRPANGERTGNRFGIRLLLGATAGVAKWISNFLKLSIALNRNPRTWMLCAAVATTRTR